MNRDRLENPGDATHAVFATTRWSLVLNAGEANSSHHQEALAQLCEIYWYPLYAFARRQGVQPHDAQDLIQGFFEKLLQRNVLGQADQAKGRFRGFLLGCLKHFLCNHWAHSKTVKRGGKEVHIPLDSILAERRFELEPKTDESPDKIFVRNWAVTLLRQARDRLEDEYKSAGKQDRYDALVGFLPGGQPRGSYSQVAKKLRLSEGALRIELHRMKAAYRKLLRTEISHTVTTPAEVDDELSYLIESIA